MILSCSVWRVMLWSMGYHIPCDIKNVVCEATKCMMGIRIKGTQVKGPPIMYSSMINVKQQNTNLKLLQKQVIHGQM